MARMGNTGLLIGCFFGGLAVTSLVLLLLYLTVRRRKREVQSTSDTEDAFKNVEHIGPSSLRAPSTSQHGSHAVHALPSPRFGPTIDFDPSSTPTMQEAEGDAISHKSTLYSMTKLMSDATLTSNSSDHTIGDTATTSHRQVRSMAAPVILQVQSSPVRDYNDGDFTVRLQGFTSLGTSHPQAGSAFANTSASEVSVNLSLQAQQAHVSGGDSSIRHTSNDHEARSMHGEMMSYQRDAVLGKAGTELSMSQDLGQKKMPFPSRRVSVTQEFGSRQHTFSVGTSTSTKSLTARPSLITASPHHERTRSIGFKRSHRMRLQSMSGFLSARNSVNLSSDSHAERMDLKAKRPSSMTMANFTFPSKRSIDLGSSTERGKKLAKPVKRSQSVDLLMLKPFQSVSHASTYRQDEKDVDDRDACMQHGDGGKHELYSTITHYPRPFSFLATDATRHALQSFDERRISNQSVNTITGQKRASLQVIGTPMSDSLDTSERFDDHRRQRSSLRFVYDDLSETLSPLH